MKRIFRIFVIDDRTNIRLYDLGVFKAETPVEAREIAAKYFRNKSIVTKPELYGVMPVTEAKLKQDYVDGLEELKARTTILN